MKTFCPFFRLRFLDQRLPGGQSNQRDGGRLFHREVPGFLRDRIFFDRDQLGERTDAILVWPCIDFVTGFESPHSRSDFEHDPSHVVAQDEREAIGQKLLELARPDFGIQLVHASGVDLDQYVVFPHHRVRHFASP